jgi:hypothetical protein
VQGTCTIDARAGILIAQNEEMQSFKVKGIGDFTQLGNRDRRGRSTGDEASSHSSREVFWSCIELRESARCLEPRTTRLLLEDNDSLSGRHFMYEDRLGSSPDLYPALKLVVRDSKNQSHLWGFCRIQG